MILNKKKGLVMLPLAALLFTSCSPWKGIDYKAAKEFIDTNYKLDGAKALYPTKVHEKFNATAADDTSLQYATVLATMSYMFFYSPSMTDKLDWGTKAPYKCNYEDDYKPIKEGEDLDFPISPIVSEVDLENSDYLIPSDEATGSTATYQVNGKQFRQKCNGKSGSITMEQVSTYNDKGYRIEVTGKCSANGEMTDPTTGKKVNLNFNFTYSGNYTYAE